jgi:hypothetical protein
MAASELELTRAANPFYFYTRLYLRELTGLKARNVKELTLHLKTVPDAVIYYHTHRFFQEHQHLSPESSNDFAAWVTLALNEVELGEKLASINTIEFTNLQSLRAKIVSILESFLEKTKRALREANEGQEFHFLKSVSFIFPTAYQAASLEEFVSILEKITIHSLYFHMFESRLWGSVGTNDFSAWLETSFGEKELAKKIARLDPYTYTLEGLRTKIISLVRGRLEKAAHAGKGV